MLRDVHTDGNKLGDGVKVYCRCRSQVAQWSREHKVPYAPPSGRQPTNNNHWIRKYIKVLTSLPGDVTPRGLKSV